LGLAFCCRRSSEKLVAFTLAEMQARGEIDDPLLAFTNQLETQSTETYSETVNLVPMFTAAAAVRRMLHSARAKREELATQMTNADRVADRAATTNWHPIRPALPMQSGVLLLESKNQDTHQVPIDLFRQRFLSAGIALTVYENGMLRASLSDYLLPPVDLNRLKSVLLQYS
jgi:hypothetical protein